MVIKGLTVLIPVDVNCRKVVVFTVPRHPVIQYIIKHLIIILGTLQLRQATTIGGFVPIRQFFCSQGPLSWWMSVKSVDLWSRSALQVYIVWVCSIRRRSQSEPIVKAGNDVVDIPTSEDIDDIISSFYTVVCAEILDDIDVRMDHTNTRLIKETSHVKRVTAKSSTCGELLLLAKQSFTERNRCTTRNIMNNCSSTHCI